MTEDQAFTNLKKEIGLDELQLEKLGWRAAKLDGVWVITPPGHQPDTVYAVNSTTVRKILPSVQSLQVVIAEMQTN